MYFHIKSHFRSVRRTILVLACALLMLPQCMAALKAALVTQSGLARGWDQVVNDRLVSLGFTVTVIDHQSAAFTPAVAETYDLVFMSESCASTAVAALAVPEAKVPVYLAEPLIWNDWHLTTAADVTQNNDGQTGIAVSGTSHPIHIEAGSTTGTVVVYNTASRQHTQPIGNFVPSVRVLGTLVSDATRLSMWAVDNGATLGGGFTAQQRRACFPLTGLDTQVRVAADMTPAGFKLFDATIHWLVPASAGPPVSTLPAPLIDLNASTLTLGALSAWPNYGSLGGTFNSITEFKFTGNPVVETVSGKQAATFNSNGMRATVSPPSTITGTAAKITVVFQSFNPDFNASPAGSAAGVEVALEWGPRSNGNWVAFGIGNTQPWNAASFFGTNHDFSYSPALVAGVSPLSPSAGAWHVSVITYDGTIGQCTAYVDNVQTNQAIPSAFATINITGIPFCMGGTQDAATNRNVTASFARVQVYDKVFTPAQVTEIYNKLTAAAPAPNATNGWTVFQ